MSVEQVRRDDLDQSAGADTHTIKLDDRLVKVDLGKANYDKLAKFLAPYLDAGKERVSSDGNGNGHVSVSYNAVRAWAKENKIKGVPDRGRPPKDIVNRYLAANPQPAEADNEG